MSRKLRAILQLIEDNVNGLKEKKRALLIQLAARTILKSFDCLRLQLKIDKMNFAAVKMWFIINPPVKATVQVENIDDFRW
ncbi:hypothetical protein SADUNF_Sadunf03G0065000 [Salix dunnii]|uniref:Uncharacterized protein n=1 Tax=Salix dunnii TaxID=1413687 RepID=A0A835N482_9ROSI|nr:hypothetical protein SADUNF_Sadunf03G0065000 [Salix dunnii]